MTDKKTEEFIRKANTTEKHTGKYDYSKTIYINAKKKIIITCKIHGDFLQTPSDHLSGCGCPKCSGYHVYSNTEFIEKCKQKHGNTYDYSKTEYRNAKEKVIVTCKIHGDFLQTPSDHLSGKGCIKCGRERTKTSKTLNLEEIIKRFKNIHANTYDYSLIKEYSTAKRDVSIICKKHGIFKQTPSSHFGGKGCPVCARIKVGMSSRLTQDDFIKKSIEIHGHIYAYNNVDYRDNRTKVEICCPKHGYFRQKPSSHLGGCGCPKCHNSRGEIIISKYLDRNSIEYSQNKSFNGCLYKKILRFDFYLPTYNIALEFDGIQHFTPVEWLGGYPSFQSNLIRDNIKNNFCINNNIGLIRIRYDEIYKIDEILTECITRGIRYRGLPVETCQLDATI